MRVLNQSDIEEVWRPRTGWIYFRGIWGRSERHTVRLWLAGSARIRNPRWRNRSDWRSRRRCI